MTLRDILERYPHLKKKLFPHTIEVLKSLSEILGEAKQYEEKSAELLYLAKAVEEETEFLTKVAQGYAEASKYLKACLDNIENIRQKLEDIYLRYKMMEKELQSEVYRLGRYLTEETDLFEELLKKKNELMKKTPAERIIDFANTKLGPLFIPLLTGAAKKKEHGGGGEEHMGPKE